MTSRRLLFVAATLLIGLTDCSAALGQDGGRRYSMILRSVPMDEALEELARIARIDLIYSSDLVSDRVVYCDGRGMEPESLLRCILSGSGLDYVRSSTGTYVLIESLRGNPLFGDLAGRIVDGSTGAPLPHANVLLADASSGTTTDEAGLFSFASVISGRHRVVVTYVGYETTIDSIIVEPGGRQTVEIGLEPATVSMDAVVIDGLAQRLPSRGLGSGTTTAAGGLDEGLFGTPDVARAAAGIAGVSMRHPLADLHIQGGEAGEHLTLIDGVPVRDPVTLGRHLSAFSPLAIARMTVHKAGFGASQGSHLSGVVSLEHDVSSSTGRSASLHVDPISVAGKAEGRLLLSENRHADAMISLRSSIWDVFRDPGLESLLDRWNAVDPILAGIWIDEPVSTRSLRARHHVPDLQFNDLHAAARADLSAFSTLHASAYRATNRIGSELAVVNVSEDYAADGTDVILLTLDDYDWTNWTGQVRHTWLADARSAITTQVRASGNTSGYRYHSIYDTVPAGLDAEGIASAAAGLRPALEGVVGSNEVNRIHEWTAGSVLSRSLSPGREMDIALEATRVDSWFELGNQFVAPFSHSAGAWQVAGYADGSLSLGLETTIEPGVRLTYLPDRRTLYAEPRLSARFDRSSSPFGPYALRIAGGLYRQFIPSFALTSSGSTSAVPFVRFWLPSDASLAPPRAYHLAAEGLFMPAANWTVSLESYYKWHPRLLMVDYASLVRNHPSVHPRPDPAPLRQSDFIAASSGRSAGGSVRVSYRGIRHSSSVQYGYSLAERRYPNRFGEELQPVPWNEPHRLSASLRYDVTPSFSVNADGEASWGRRWALRRAYYDYLALLPAPAAFPPFQLDDPAASKVPAFIDVDLGATYEISWHPVTLRVQAAVANVLNRRNMFDRSLEAHEDAYRAVGRSLPGRRPVLSMRLTY
jgi:hypothetical protein